MKTMKRTAVLLALCVFLLPTAAFTRTIELVNEFGSVTITDAGILSRASELTGFDKIHVLRGHSLGSVSFSTGALTSGSIFAGGTFSSAGSTFVVTGNGSHGAPKGIIFNGSFFGTIDWTLLQHTGNNYVFALEANLLGMLHSGRLVTGTTMQTIYLNLNQWNHNQHGSIGPGHTAAGFSDGIPEPGTLGLFATGLFLIARAMWGKHTDIPKS
jgi:hypothetical protein